MRMLSHLITLALCAAPSSLEHVVFPCGETASSVGQVELGEDDALPEWLHLMPFGSWKGHSSGEFEFTEEHAQEAVATFQALGIDIVIDYEHQTQLSAMNGQPAPAAGWIDGLEVRANGLWGHVKRWSADAEAHLKAGHYRYLSPTYRPAQVHPRTGDRMGARIVSAALTNLPFLAGDLEPIAATDNPTQGSDVNYKLLLCSLLGLAATAEAAADVSDDAINQAVPDAKSRLELGEAVEAKLSDKPGWSDGDLAARKGLVTRELDHQGYVSMSEHMALLQSQGGGGKTPEQLVQMALDKGVITPATKAASLKLCKADPQGFQEWMATAPKVVPVEGVKPPAGGGGGGSTEHNLTDVELEVCKQLGIEPKDFKTTKSELDGAAA